jgi:oxygen-dependent protoporphyrinogen oxidase
MATLVEHLLRGVARSATIRTGTRATALTPAGSTWRISTDRGPSLEADALVLAVPPRAAAQLLAPLEPGAAEILRGLTLHSNLSVTLAWPAESVSHPLDASGFVVRASPGTEPGLRACAFCSSKFPDRAPSGSVLLRAFYRPTAADPEPDEAWIARATRDIAPVLGISGPPSGAWVAQWPGAIPEYRPDSSRLFEELQARVRGVGVMQLAGAAYLPGGIPGAVRSGVQAVRNLITHPLPA